MNAEYISPKLNVATRWLSVYDVIENFMKMFDIYIYIYIVLLTVLSMLIIKIYIVND